MAIQYRFGSPQCWEILTSDGRTIPVDPDNTDYAELIASGTPIAAHDAELLPGVGSEEAITRSQLLKALALHGVLQTADVLEAIEAAVLPPAVEAAVAGMPSPLQSHVRAALSIGTALTRGGVFVQVCDALGIAGGDLDSVWAVAVATQDGGAA